MILGDFTSVPAKQLALMKKEKAIGAIWIGTFRQHGRSAKNLVKLDFTPEGNARRTGTSLLPAPEFFDSHVIATALVIFAGAFFYTALDSRLQLVLIIVVKSGETEGLQAPIHRIQHFCGAEH